MNPQSAKDWSEPVKNYVQVAAIIVAGWWTYNLFVQKDAPGLEARGNATSRTYWNAASDSPDSDWELEFNVLLENKGTTSFDISKVHVRGWEFDPPNREGDLTFFDPEAVQRGPTFFDHVYDIKPGQVLPFPSHYPPGASYENAFVWLVKPDCNKRVYFEAEFYKMGKSDAPNWSTYSWGKKCSKGD